MNDDPYEIVKISGTIQVGIILYMSLAEDFTEFKDLKKILNVCNKYE